MNSDTVKLKLTIAYDGTNYSGWQVQDNGLAVQQKVEEAVNRMFPGASRLNSSSRTDAGVHAMGMVAHVEIPAEKFRMTMHKVALALNAHLPEDIRIMEAKLVPASFHARFQASGKEYRYLVWNGPAMNPLLRTQAWHIPKPLDLDRMRLAAKQFVGTHDFRSFAATRSYVTEDTVRTVTQCSVTKSGQLLTFTIRGNGFLYKMCRGIVGTLVQIGQGKYPGKEINHILDHKDRREAGMTAPAHGLVLWKVFYGRKDRKTPRSDQEE